MRWYRRGVGAVTFDRFYPARAGLSNETVGRGSAHLWGNIDRRPTRDAEHVLVTPAPLPDASETTLGPALQQAKDPARGGEAEPVRGGLGAVRYVPETLALVRFEHRSQVVAVEAIDGVGKVGEVSSEPPVGSEDQSSARCQRRARQFEEASPVPGVEVGEQRAAP